MASIGAVAGAALAGVIFAGGAAAQSGATPFGGFEHDSTQPVEVAADALEVRNADQKAIFSGNVRVRQGEVAMKAEWLEVTYAGRGGAANAASGGGAIDRLRARGNVIITNGAEMAKSREADYDVAAAEISLAGDVLLVQGQNVIKGDRLKIDLATGTARMVSEGDRVKVQLDPSSAQ
ncbi:MAG: LptA/OstA family protein [Pseudomonadota bacterium]